MSYQSEISNAVDLLQDLEGFSARSYWDVNGYAIGYGNHYYQDGSSVGPNDTISQAAALDLLEQVAADQANAILPQITVQLAPGLLTALISLRYNCGTITQALKNLINSGAPLDQVKTQFLATCTTSQGVYNSYLVQRRQIEWDQVGASNSFIAVALVALAALVGIKLVKR